MTRQPLSSSSSPSQRRLWRVTKGDGAAEAVLRTLPDDDEIRVYVRGELLTSSEFHGDPVKLETFSVTCGSRFSRTGGTNPKRPERMEPSDRPHPAPKEAPAPMKFTGLVCPAAVRRLPSSSTNAHGVDVPLPGLRQPLVG